MHAKRRAYRPMVDHIVPINKGGAPLDMDNLQSLCSHCHAAKTARDK